MGVKFYWPATPCKRGHVCKRSLANRACCECSKMAEKDRERHPAYAARKRELRKGWRQKEKIASQRRRTAPDSWPSFLIIGARHRAKMIGREFDITVDDIEVVTICPVLGIEMKPNFSGRAKPNSPTIDRIDNSKGYIKGNVRMISYRANMLKRDAGVDEIRMLLAYMEAAS